MINAVIKRGDYDFICSQFEDRLDLLGVCGNYAYGTSTDKSGINLRGIASLSKSDILLNQGFGVLDVIKW